MAKGTTDFSAQRPAIDVNLPAIARHIAYRIPKWANPRLHEDDADRLWEIVLGSLSDHFAAIQDALGCTDPDFVCFKVPGQLDPYPRGARDGKYLIRSVSKSAIVEPKLPGGSGFRFRLRVDVYNEIVGITYILDSINQGKKPKFSQLYSAINSLVFGPDDPSEKVAEEQRQQLDFLYDGFWRQPCEFCAVIEGGPGRRAFKEMRLLDFRGIYLDCAPVDRTDSVKEATKHRPLDRPANWLGPLQEFANRRRDLVDHAIGRSEARLGGGNAGEPVFCTMLGGDALYLAELGRSNNVGAIEPLRHMLVFADAPSSQVGRLVRRLLVMGELRHAALLDYDNGNNVDLKGVSRELRQIGPSIDRVLRTEGAKDAGAEQGDAPLKSETAGGPLEAIGGVIQKVARLRANDDDDGVTYRVQQSRYYAEQFRKGLGHLRTGRIIGYQSYDDFVSRYIFQAFARVDSVGNRYDSMLRRLNLAATYKTAVEINRYQADTRKTLRAMETAACRHNTLLETVQTTSDQQREILNKVDRNIEQQNRLAGEQYEILEKVDRNTEKQNRLLETAEKLALAVLVYYAGSAAHTVFKDMFDSHLSPKWIHVLVDVLWLGLVFLFAILAFISMKRTKKLTAAEDAAGTNPPRAGIEPAAES